jgi:hypothetical protein
MRTRIGPRRTPRLESLEGRDLPGAIFTPLDGGYRLLNTPSPVEIFKAPPGKPVALDPTAPTLNGYYEGAHVIVTPTHNYIVILGKNAPPGKS